MSLSREELAELRTHVAQVTEQSMQELALHMGTTVERVREIVAMVALSTHHEDWLVVDILVTYYRVLVSGSVAQ